MHPSSSTISSDWVEVPHPGPQSSSSPFWYPGQCTQLYLPYLYIVQVFGYSLTTADSALLSCARTDWLESMTDGAIEGRTEAAVSLGIPSCVTLQDMCGLHSSISGRRLRWYTPTSSARSENQLRIAQSLPRADLKWKFENQHSSN